MLLQHYRISEKTLRKPRSYSTICGVLGGIWERELNSRPHHASPRRGKYRIISARRGCELAEQQGMRNPFYIRCESGGVRGLLVTGAAQQPPRLPS